MKLLAPQMYAFDYAVIAWRVDVEFEAAKLGNYVLPSAPDALAPVCPFIPPSDLLVICKTTPQDTAQIFPGLPVHYPRAQLPAQLFWGSSTTFSLEL